MVSVKRTARITGSVLTFKKKKKKRKKQNYTFQTNHSQSKCCTRDCTEKSCTGTPSRSTASFQLYFKHVLDVKWSLRPITKNSRKGLAKSYQKRNAIDPERGNDQGRGTEKWWSRKNDPMQVVLFLYILPYQPRVPAGICEMQQHK